MLGQGSFSARDKGPDALGSMCIDSPACSQSDRPGGLGFRTQAWPWPPGLKPWSTPPLGLVRDVASGLSAQVCVRDPRG